MSDYLELDVSERFKDTPNRKSIGKSKYPWETLGVGKAFLVSYDAVNNNTLLSLAYKAGRRLNKKFRVVRHNDRKVYEVGRLPDSEIKHYKPRIEKPPVNPAYLERTSYGTRVKDDNGNYTEEYHAEQIKLHAMNAAERAAYDASFGIVKAEWGQPAKPVEQANNQWPTTWTAQPIEEGE